MKFFLDSKKSHYRLDHARFFKQKIELINFNGLLVSSILFNIPSQHNVYIVVDDLDDNQSYFQYYAQNSDRLEKLHFGTTFLLLKMKSARFDYQKMETHTEESADLSWEITYL